jgi:hypothetical protein
MDNFGILPIPNLQHALWKEDDHSWILNRGQ